MLTRNITATIVGAATLGLSVPAMTQERGTIEFGAFARGSSYDSSLNMDNAWGGGGRVGAFIFPRLSVEFSIGGSPGAGRPDGRSVEVESLAARLTAVPLVLGPLSFLAGAGIIHTDYQIRSTNGLQGLVGAKLALGSSVALRVDGLADFNRDDTRNQALQVGLSVYRRPTMLTRTVTVVAPAPPVTAAAPNVQRPDSVSAAETRRLRAVEVEHQALLDSLTAARMTEVIHFAHDISEVSATARAILDDKVMVFQESPSMRIVITGFASRPGTEAYNMALGLRRAEATKAYLVSRGVVQSRIEIATGGEDNLVAEGSGEGAAAANRRGEFRLLIAEPGR